MPAQRQHRRLLTLVIKELGVCTGGGGRRRTKGRAGVTMQMQMRCTPGTVRLATASPLRSKSTTFFFCGARKSWAHLSHAARGMGSNMRQPAPPAHPEPCRSQQVACRAPAEQRGALGAQQIAGKCASGALQWQHRADTQRVSGAAAGREAGR